MNHLKIILLSLCFCFVLTIGWSQTLIGIKGQVNNFDAPLVVEVDLFSKTLNNLLNPGFGIAVQQVISPKWILQLEANYQEARQSYLISGAESRINTSIIKYIRVPLLAKRNISFGDWSFQAMAGPNFGYGLQLLSGNTTLDYRESKFARLEFAKYDVKRFDLGLLMGMGIEKIVSKTFTTSLSLRYNLGLVDILQNDQSYFFTRGYILEMAIYVPLDPSKIKE
jgi:hypothetical protein